MGKDLFASDDDRDEISNIGFNEEYAKRYEHNKKREDLQRLEERKKKGLVSDSDDESDDSDSWENGAVDDVKLFDALLKIRKKDPALLEKDVKLFDSGSDNDDDDDEEEEEVVEEEEKKKKKKEKMYLKDVNAKHLIELGPEFGGEEDEEEEEVAEEDLMKVKSYAEEQEELRKAFLEAAEEAEGEEEGDLLREKPRESDEGGGGEEEIKERLDEFFGEDERLDEKDLFLKEFFKKKMWIEKGNGEGEEEDVEFSEDEEEIERQEEYEREYNFRFEEGAGDRVESHSRFVGDSVRKVENPRKEQRKRKKERMEEAEKERREEVKRLKNVKKREIMEKMNRIKMVAGLDEGVEIALTEADLEEEFDPVKYDKKMKDAFGDEYYGLEDVDSDFVKDDDEIDMEKPDFGKEDKLLGLPEDWDVCKPGEGFLSERKKYLQTVEEGEDEGKEESEDGEGPSVGKRKRKRKMSLKEKLALDKDLEELYKLDYEDTIGDLKTRFKYKTVVPKRYGLTADELVTVDEKELNQVVSIKRLAPYREKEWVVPQDKLIALRNKKRNEHETYEGGKHKKRRTEEKEEQQAIVDSEAMSRKEKRKHRKGELKISESRLKAYGKIPSKSNNKSKN